jgi:hypothetical protein
MNSFLSVEQKLEFRIRTLEFIYNNHDQSSTFLFKQTLQDEMCLDENSFKDIIKYLIESDYINIFEEKIFIRYKGIIAYERFYFYKKRFDNNEEPKRNLNNNVYVSYGHI